jgi:hypothetical protein
VECTGWSMNLTVHLHLWCRLRVCDTWLLLHSCSHCMSHLYHKKILYLYFHCLIDVCVFVYQESHANVVSIVSRIRAE